MDTYLIVGLGNPGPEYEMTRHNIGALVLEELCARTYPMPTSLKAHKRTNTLIAETSLGKTKVIFARLRCFMNLSGGPVKALANFFRIPPERIIVIFDDLELDFGQIKTRLGGGDHGHNGLKNITKALGTSNYQRCGVGIGRPPGRMEVKSFVLKPFGKQERAELPIICADAADAIEELTTS